MTAGSIEAFLSWAGTRNIGCLFAQAMFRKLDHYNLTAVELEGVDDLSARLAGQVQLAVATPNVEGIVVTLPAISDVTSLAKLLRELELQHGWELRLTDEVHDGHPYVAVGVDVPVGHEDGVPVLGEAVVFAPLDYLPHTRRAPVTTFALRTKPTMSGDPLPGKTERRANLAAIKVDMEGKVFDRLWTKSQQLRQELDGKDHPLARARVAIGIPQATWEAITHDTISA